jgi:hypothetical protein
MFLRELRFGLDASLRKITPRCHSPKLVSKATKMMLCETKITRICITSENPDDGYEEL